MSALWQNQAFWTLLGVVVGGLLTVGKDWISDSRSQSRLGTYAAIRIVCVLDIFADRCLDVANDDGEDEIQSHGQYERVFSVKTPSTPTFADDIDWKSLDADLAYKLLSFPAEVDEANSVISFTLSVISGPPDYSEGFEERQLRYATLGVAALELTDALRRKYGLRAKVQANSEWSAAVRLPEIKAKIEREREESARRQAERHRKAEEAST